MFRPMLLLAGLILLHLSCGDGREVNPEITAQPLQLEIKRFDSLFINSRPADLPRIKTDYPYLFPATYTDSIWEAKMADTLQADLFTAVDSVFGSFSKQEADLELLFKHIVYYFPRVTVPKVVTVISDVDYRNRVILADTLLLLGLDNYLGPDHRFYVGIDRYIAKGLDSDLLASDVATAVARRLVPYPDNRSFLSRMIYYGKILYLKERWMPLEDDTAIIGYSREELQWAEANEEQIWRYFIEQDLLYSTDSKLDARFLDPAPFSKFRLELDNESPGRLGRYLGWQIVRAFMEKEQPGLTSLPGLPADEIFKRSSYKPKK